MPSDFMKMDIFFMVTTAVVAVLGILLAVLLWYALRIARQIEHISRSVAEETEYVREDIARLRTRIREEGFRFTHTLALLRSVAQRLFSLRRRRSEDRDPDAAEPD